MLFFVTAFTREYFELVQLRSSASNPPTRKASLCSAKVVDLFTNLRFALRFRLTALACSPTRQLKSRKGGQGRKDLSAESEIRDVYG
ncbi:hypothetical protein ASJ83_08615 [Methanocorpusculum parvum]|uniref:Uncharacterized protein n=1 Tax=Methanocorpusculum parvum TaxID=2193 RepID=A0AAX0Q7B5_9EURY|nr:hypothetical protein ASJ83_08615 [Methanocorpusculum parvum]